MELAVVENNWLCDFMDLDIEDDGAVLDFIQGKTTVVEVLDLVAISDFIVEWNKEYCTNHDLCPECRAKLEEAYVDVPYGDTIVREIEGLRCPYCG